MKQSSQDYIFTKFPTTYMSPLLESSSHLLSIRKFFSTRIAYVKEKTSKQDDNKHSISVQPKTTYQTEITMTQ